MANYLHVLIFSIAGGLLSLVGGALMLSRKNIAQNLARYATPFAAGALLAAALFELFPESVGISGASGAAKWVLVGIVAFFLLEHFIHWFHHNHKHQDKHRPAVAPLIIIGDTVHNLIDGIAIGAAFLIDVPTGIVTALAVASHEIPQEIGDFGLLLKSGFQRRNVLLINTVSALAATLGALLTFWVGSQSQLPIGPLLAVTAGLFIYIAASDLIPAIHEETAKKANTYVAAGLLLLGIATVGVATTMAHEYTDSHGDTGDHSLHGAESEHGHDDDIEWLEDQHVDDHEDSEHVKNHESSGHQDTKDYHHKEQDNDHSELELLQ